MNDLSRYTAMTLRVGIVLGLALMVIGLISGGGILSLGLLALIASPLAGVAVTTICLCKERDLFWTGVALVLIIVVTAGVVVSLLR